MDSRYYNMSRMGYMVVVTVAVYEVIIMSNAFKSLIGAQANSSGINE